MSQNHTGSGIYLGTDPDQEKASFYRVAKTANITTTLAQIQATRAMRDFKIIKFFPVQDLKKAEEFIRSALKNKYLPNSTEWVKTDENGINKIANTVETLVDIVNNSE